MPSSDPVPGCALVLAAGRGRRMGGPKALMPVAGRPWWRWQVERLSACRRRQVWIVSSDVAAAMDGDSHAPADLVRSDPDAPMFESVAAGLPTALATDSPWIHVLPIDVPTPVPGTFEALEAAAGEDGVAVPIYGGATGHPICLASAWVTRVLVPLVARGRTRDSRLDHLTQPARRMVEVDDRDVAINLNMPDDIAAWLAQVPRQ